MKYFVVLGDGMADRPFEGLGGKTPLEVANHPTMDFIASKGMCGMAKTVPEGMPPGSDTANLSAMGMNMDDVISFRVPAYADSVNPDAKIVPGALTSLCVASEGEHVEEAVEFVKFITSEEGMIAYANGAYDIPAIQISDMSKLNPSLAAMLSSMSFESNWWSQNAVTINKIFEEMIVFLTFISGICYDFFVFEV